MKVPPAAPTPTGIAILSNTIVANGGLGIDLNDDGVTLNDPGDPDTGPNNLQNFPVVTNAVADDTGNTAVAASINSTPNTVFMIQLFVNDAADPSGYGEGQSYRRTTLGGDAFVTTDDQGNASFTAVYPFVLAAGQTIALTATDEFGSTSEFSRVFSGFVVTNSNDTGSGSLRQVITNANATPGVQTITFNIPGTGVQTITPASALPAITESVLIDGYTQPGASPNTLAVGDDAVILVAINGSALGNNAGGLVLSAGTDTVRGLAIGGFLNFASGGQITVNSGVTALIVGNFLGTDATGTVPLGGGNAGNQGVTGIYINAPNATVGGTAPAARNLLSSNVGVNLFGTANASGLLVQGNYFGTNPSGTANVGTTANNLQAFGANATIGGTAAGAGNLVSATSIVSNSSQVDIHAPGALVQGNRLGTDATGSIVLGTISDGIDFNESGGLNATIGGTAPGAGNVIAGYRNFGIRLSNTGGFLVQGNLVQGNRIGTDATGTVLLGAGNVGVTITSSSGVGATRNTIGGTTSAAANVIGGNKIAGITIGSNNDIPGLNLVQGNFIGTDRTGTRNLGNQDGVFLGAESNTTIGGTVAGAGNTIAFNTRTGIFNSRNNPSSTANVNDPFLGNAIYSNGALGIAQGPQSAFPDPATTPNPNDLGDADGGENNGQNYPVLTSVATAANVTTFTGTLNSIANSTFLLEFFANAAADPTGLRRGAAVRRPGERDDRRLGQRRLQPPVRDASAGRQHLLVDRDGREREHLGVLGRPPLLGPELRGDQHQRHRLGLPPPGHHRRQRHAGVADHHLQHPWAGRPDDHAGLGPAVDHRHGGDRRLFPSPARVPTRWPSATTRSSASSWTARAPPSASTAWRWSAAARAASSGAWPSAISWGGPVSS